MTGRHEAEFGWLGQAVTGLARGLALIGGALVLAVAAMVVVSITGRALDGLGPLGPVRGDYEMVAHGCAIAVFCFMPWCHLQRGHVTVDIVADRLPGRGKALLGLLGDICIAVAAAVIARQLWLGFGEKFPYGGDAFRAALGMGYKPFFPETTYELQVPVWILYAVALLAAGGLVIVSLYAVARAALWVARGQEPTQ